MESARSFILSKRYSLSYYLVKNQMYWLSYLHLPIPWYNKPGSIFCYFVCLVYLIRVIIYIFVPLEPSLALYFGDFAYDSDSLHDFIWSILSCWLTASIFAFHLLDGSNRSVKLQAWFIHLSILEKGKDHFFKKPNAKLVFASKLLFINLKTTLLCCPSFAFCLFIPHIINNCSNATLVIVLLIHGLTTFIAALTGVTFCVSLSYLFAFYAFLVGQKLTYISKIFKSHKSCHRKIFTNSNQLISLLQQAYYADFFWSKLNAYVFLATFFAQIFIIYSVFFIPLDKIHFICLIGLGLINFTCGLSVNFVCGAYARSKLNDCQKQLIRVIFIKDAELRLQLKIKLLLISEYLLPRKLFAIFGSLEMTSINYLKVFSEMAIHLFLVILNANRRK